MAGTTKQEQVPKKERPLPNTPITNNNSSFYIADIIKEKENNNNGYRKSRQRRGKAIEIHGQSRRNEVTDIRMHCRGKWYIEKQLTSTTRLWDKLSFAIKNKANVETRWKNKTTQKKTLKSKTKE